MLQPRDGGEDGCGVKDMLLDLDAGMEAFCCIIGEHGDVGLHDDFTCVHAGIDIVHGAAGGGGTGFEGLFPCFHTGEGGEEGRMDVENAVGEGLEERGLNKTHETSEAYQINLEVEELLGNGLLAFQGEFVFKATTVHHFGTDAALASTFQNVGIGVVGENDNNLGIEASVIYSIENRLAVAAGTGT